jgi:signal transduction histidine kinase
MKKILEYIKREHKNHSFDDHTYENSNFVARQVLAVKIAFWLGFSIHLFFYIDNLIFKRFEIQMNAIAILIGFLPCYYFLTQKNIPYAKFFVYYPGIFIQAIISYMWLMKGHMNQQAEIALIAYASVPIVFYKFPFSVIGVLINFLLFVLIKIIKYPLSDLTFFEFYSELLMVAPIYLALIFITYFYKLDFLKMNEINDKLSEQKQIIEAQSEKLKVINSTKDRLFSIIAHDLRSPLSSLKGVMQLLDNEYISKEEFQELSKRLQQNVDSVHGMLENLLLWSLSQMEGIKPNVKPFDLNSIIEETVKLFEEISVQKQIDLRHNSTINFQALGDEYQIRTVLRNLLNNALKFTPSHGQISINSSVNGQFINLKISDSGVGIERNDLAQIFSNPKLNAGTAGEKGTGFGLFLCKELIEKNGGSIDVNSEFGKGTTIEILLPLMMN